MKQQDMEKEKLGWKNKPRKKSVLEDKLKKGYY